MHAYANPARFLRIARPLTPVLLLSGLAISLAAFAYALTFAPPERLQGETVRILPLHVATAWAGMSGWTAIAGASLVELVWRHPLAAIAARASALPGAVDREGGASRVAAIFGLVGAINIPIIHYSVIWWNSLHQAPSITTGGSAMAGPYLALLLAATLGVFLLFAGVVLARMRAILAETQAEARLRRKALEA